MSAETGVAIVAQTAQVNDALHIAPCDRISELGRRLAVTVTEASSRAFAHPVHQVVGNVNADSSSLHRLGVAHVTLDDLDVVTPRQSIELLRGTSQTTHLVACIEQLRDQTAADVARGSGEE